MTQNEMARYRVINQTIDKVITIREAAELLNLSERQIIRIKKGVAQEGAAFIIHKNRGCKPAHAISDNIKDTIIKLKQSKYAEANFKHFQELLEEHEAIQISYSSVHRILSEAGIKSPKKHRKRKSHHRRKRKPQKGMLVQIDASPFEWIIGGESFDLHGAIDDATGDIFALFFTPNECMEGYFEIARQIIMNYGIPISFYCDCHTIFVSPNENKISIEDQLEGKVANLTQFGQAMKELGINIIKARSPQAKGRIERLWGTLQSRLPVEFKINGITTMEEANAFLETFIKKYNEKFGLIPENPESAFRPLDSSINLDYILCKKDQRTIIEGSAFSFGGHYYQLIKDGKPADYLPKARLTVLFSNKIGVKAVYEGTTYDTIMLEDRPKKITQNPLDVQSKKEVKKKVKPREDHPWRLPRDKNPMLLYEETDAEIISLLNDLFSSKRAWV